MSENRFAEAEDIPQLIHQLVGAASTPTGCRCPSLIPLSRSTSQKGWKMPETNWRYRVLSAARHLNHWCYRNFWIPRRIATAVENLHWRVERWAVDEGCVIHNRTAHHMQHWTLHWRGDRGIFERLCPDHGIGHPDPDQGPYWTATGQDWQWVHGCCGCCKAGVVEVGEGHPSDWLFEDDDE